MRAIHAVLLLGALGAGCAQDQGHVPPPLGPVCPETPAPKEQTVTITFGKNPSAKDACELMDVEPINIVVCAADTIRWEFANECSNDVEAHIGARKRLFPTGKMTDPLADPNGLLAKPIQIPPTITTRATGTNPAVTGTVDLGAEPGHYKYGIEGKIEGTVFTIDPEIDVRRRK